MRCANAAPSGTPAKRLRPLQELGLKPDLKLTTTREGRLICDEIAPRDKMDEALINVIDRLTSSGVVSAVANRRAFRIGQEPIDLFRQYLAVYAREQAYCHFSPALIANLERHWKARERKI